MNALRLLSLFALVCCFACKSDKTDLNALHGRWVCDGEASVALIPSVAHMDPVDRLLTAQIYDTMHMTIDAKEQEITLNLGNRQGKQNFSLLHGSDGAVHLMTDELLSIEPKGDSSILVYDPRDSSQKMVFRRM